jgi:hypothetical protein
MKHLPKALDRNGDLWVPTATKHLVFRALKDVRQALEATQGLEAGNGLMIDHAEQLKSLAVVEQLLGLDSFDRPLPPVHEQLGEPTEKQARVLRNLFRLAAV